MLIKIEKDENMRLDCFLINYFQKTISRNQINKIIDDKKVYVNKTVKKSSYKLKINDIVEFDDNIDFTNKEKSLVPWEFDLDIKYEDDDIIVLNKPKDLICHPTKYEQNKTLVNALLYHCKENLSDVSGALRPGIVHRLDKNTSGLMIAAKNNPSHINLANQIRTKSAIRKYFAIALGKFEQKSGTIDKPLVHYIKDNVKMMTDDKGLDAITNYKVIEEFKGASLVELELKTGRTHQIRAHLSSINHPLFGDELYGAKGFLIEDFRKIKTQGQLLQSYYLSFKHPKTNKQMEFQLKEEEFSKDFIKVLNFLRSKKNAD